MYYSQPSENYRLIFCYEYYKTVSLMSSRNFSGLAPLFFLLSQSAKCGVSFTAFEDHVIEGYRCNDRQFSSFVMYNLTFAHYSKHEPHSPGVGQTESL